MGAHTTAQLLTTHPERFYQRHARRSRRSVRWTAEQAARAEQEASERERECVSRGQIYRLAATNAPKPDEEAIKRLSAACMANPNIDQFALAARTRSWKDHPITPAQVAIVKVPTLGIVGSLDGYLTDFQELKKLRPEMKLVVIEGATHGGARSARLRSEFIAAVREFIASNRTASSR